tara:strand:+ start:136784 stop:138175 length:1392 start_codon:yes stop_codon:yes gene_type:complete
MKKHSSDIDLAVKNGACCILFLEDLFIGEYWSGQKGWGRSDAKYKSISNLEILGHKCINSLNATAEQGSQITSTDISAWKPLTNHLKKSTYYATFSRKFGSQLPDNFKAIALNKFEKIVGFQFESGKGLYIVLPPPVDIENYFKILLRDILPVVCPTCCPEESELWSLQKEYSTSQVLNLQNEYESAVKTHHKRLVELNTKIQEARDAAIHETRILTEQGEYLVDSCVEVLQKIGLTHIKSVDEGRSDSNLALAEDMVDDSEDPILLFEVKGLTANPTEKDLMQLVKHMLRKSRENKASEINGVMLVNHQFGMPPLKRTNGVPYTDEQIQDALTNNICLATTWDLWKIALAVDHYGWTGKDVKSILLRPGRCLPIPNNPVVAGTITKYYPEPNVISFVCEQAVSTGDHFAMILPEQIVVFAAKSLQVEKTPVEVATKGQQVGINVSPELSRKIEGSVIYKLCN